VVYRPVADSKAAAMVTVAPLASESGPRGLSRPTDDRLRSLNISLTPTETTVSEVIDEPQVGVLHIL
jgi:hypothetical protein